MKVSVVNERKLLRIELEGQPAIEIMNKTPVTEESEKAIVTFFDNWKILRGIPIIVPNRDTFVSPSIKEKRNKTQYTLKERMQRICEAFGSRERFYHTEARKLNGTAVQTTYDDLKEMVAMKKLIHVDDKIALAWKVITPDYPKVLSLDDITKHRADIRSEEGVIRDNRTI